MIFISSQNKGDALIIAIIALKALIALITLIALLALIALIALIVLISLCGQKKGCSAPPKFGAYPKPRRVGG